VLTGLLDDGTSGMSAIKRCGGICIVQEPAEADYPDMPNNVIRNVEVDYRVPIADMGYVIGDILSKPERPQVPVPADIQLEADITDRMSISTDNLKEIGTHSLLTCPDCGGGLWHINNDSIHRYRCHTGHVYNEDVLMKRQQDALEESLWVSIRMMEERRNLLLTMAQHEHDKGNTFNETENRKRAEEAEMHIDRLKALLNNIADKDDFNI
jgi:two-component system chemotaxis response regulator CheB